MSRKDLLQRIHLLSDRLTAAERMLQGAYDPIVAVGVQALREELSRLGRQVRVAG